MTNRTSPGEPAHGVKHQPGHRESTVKDKNKTSSPRRQRPLHLRKPRPVVGLSLFKLNKSGPHMLPLPKDRSINSSKSQKQITLLGEEVIWSSSDIDCRASSTDDFNTKALRTLIIF